MVLDKLPEEETLHLVVDLPIGGKRQLFGDYPRIVPLPRKSMRIG